VTRVDVAVDLPDVHMGDFVFDRPAAPIRRAILRKGKLETLYLGKNAAGQVRIYDKGAQLGDASLVLTRIEYAVQPNRTGELMKFRMVFRLAWP
jgi:DNA relaxase NicK